MEQKKTQLDSLLGNQNQEVIKLKQELHENVIPHAISPGETVASIAQRYNMESYQDLLILNQSLWKQIVMRGKNPLIHIWETIFVPKDPIEFRKKVAILRVISEAQSTSEKVGMYDRSVLKRNIRGTIFPQLPVSIWPKLLTGFIRSQEASFDPRLPRIVDHSRQENVSCANLIRTLMTQSIDMKDASREERAFFQKQKIDAWMLPEQMKVIGFKPKISLMDAFDDSKILESNPIKSGQESSYISQVKKLGKELETSAPFSLVPLYFTWSNWKWEVVNYNSWKTEKHYNTHQSMLLGNANLTLNAHEVPIIQNWKLTSFGNDTKRIQKELEGYEQLLESTKRTLDEKKEKVLSSIDITKNPELAKKANAINGVIQRYVRQFPEEIQQEKQKELETLFQTEDIVRIKRDLAKIIHWTVTDDDATYIVALQSRKRRIENGVKNILTHLNESSHGEISPGSFEWLGKDITSLPTIKRAISQYLWSLQSIQKTQENIKEKREEIENQNQKKIERINEIQQATIENIQLNHTLENQKKILTEAEKELLQSLDPEKNEFLKNRLTAFDWRINTIVGEDKRKRNLFMKALEVNDISTLERVFHQTANDSKYLQSLYKTDKKNKNTLREIRGTLESWKQSGPIPIEKLGSLVLWDAVLQKAIQSYNSSIQEKQSLEWKIQSNKEKLEKREELPLTTFVTHFVASRADYSSAWNKIGIDSIEKHLQVYAELIHITIWWKEINLAEEWKKPLNDRIRITPEDTFTISGPLMVDGWHLWNSDDKDKRANMNARTRFYFELIGTGKLLPTELIEPDKNSVFRKESYDNPIDSLQVKWTYDLRFARNENGDFTYTKQGKRISESIESVLKTSIPIFEKKSFHGLDLTKEEDRKTYDARIQIFYARQIKALELAWYLQDENILNKSATNVNRAIPYFETNGVNPVFREYVSKAKQSRTQQASETAQFRSYIEYTVYPWDSSGSVITWILQELQSQKKRQEQYKNLTLLDGINPILAKELVRRIIDQSLRSNKLIEWKDILAGNIPPWFHLKIHIKEIDHILSGMQSLMVTDSTIDTILKTEDRKILDATISHPYNRSLVKQVLVLESYERPNGQWYKPEWIRKEIKQTIQEYPVLQKVKAISSYGDFQIRIKGLSNGWNKEWPRREHIEKAIAKFEKKEVREYIETHKNSTLTTDLAQLEGIKVLLSKSPMNTEDFWKLTNTLLSLFRIDDGDNNSIVGKIISASLMEDKLNLHSIKLDGIMEKIGESRITPNDTPERIQWFNNTLLLMNNLWEKKVLYGLTENYILRVLESLSILKNHWKILTAPEIKTKFFSGALMYGPQTFMKHISSIRDQIALSLNPKERSTPELKIYHALMAFNNQVYEIEEKKIPEREKEQLLMAEIYSFLWDKELRSTLDSFTNTQNKRISSSILPENIELSWDGFRNVFFNYPRKKDTFSNLTKVM